MACGMFRTRERTISPPPLFLLCTLVSKHGDNSQNPQTGRFVSLAGERFVRALVTLMSCMMCTHLRRCCCFRCCRLPLL